MTGTSHLDRLPFEKLIAKPEQAKAVYV